MGYDYDIIMVNDTTGERDVFLHDLTKHEAECAVYSRDGKLARKDGTTWTLKIEEH